MSELFEPSEEFEQKQNTPGAVTILIIEFDTPDNCGSIPTGRTKKFNILTSTQEETGEKFDEIVREIGKITS